VPVNFVKSEMHLGNVKQLSSYQRENRFSVIKEKHFDYENESLVHGHELFKTFDVVL
jgi:hypothetical protein